MAMTLPSPSLELPKSSARALGACSQLLAVDEEVQVGAERAGRGEQLELSRDLLRQLIGDLRRRLLELLGQLEAGEGEVPKL